MKRSKMSLSSYKLLSCNQGDLVPCGLVEVLPGDTFQHSASALVRVAPLLAPIMHPVHVRVHHWFVPHRLVWDDWESFITGGSDGEDASVFPTITIGGGTGAAIGSLADYLGVPTGVNNIVCSALPFRGYAKIFNEWYRDQDLVTPLVIDTTSGVDSTTNTALQQVAWEKDYFTSARPWTQKGPEVSIPLTGDAPVTGNLSGNLSVHTPLNCAGSSKYVTQNSAGGQLWIDGSNLGASGLYAEAADANTSALEADLSGVSAANINELRLAFALQRYEEARARYGSRYTEYLRYLGVRSSDARLQRPEYLGGGKQTIQFSEVLQTGVTTDGDDTEGVGNIKGHGIGAMRSNRYRRFFEEHGYVFSFISVKPRTMYVQGLWRTWNRRTKEDFWQRELQHIGQQEVLFKELQAGHATPDGVFGYQDRYDEYRRQESSVAGEFRNTTLNFWHMARDLPTDVALNASFVQANPTNRVYASTASDQLYIMVHHSLQARRLVSASGNSFIY